MQFASLLTNLVPVTIAGLILGAGLPAVFALAMRISAGQTTRLEDGTVLQTRPASSAARAVSAILYALIVAAIVVGILWVAKDFLYHAIGFNLFGAATTK